ncbi:DUF1549 and DUF1553 domain-containing protein [Aporhodopirellula aestuarii]|uniref:DUF1549 and DUF1553 domain-containing protein n=1 Tax=Aporhodopirellula aestuarii TaxID=2950107 RepID=UPI002033B9BD|nr:DUF1549 and DUF1553 domain-containing protein [Aporhodopirellula aestuarii]
MIWLFLGVFLIGWGIDAQAVGPQLTKRQQAIKRENERKAREAARAAERARNNQIAKTNEREIPEVEITIAPVNPNTKADVLKSAAKIDAIIEADLARRGIEPNPPASNEQFMRRVYLDITGRVPRGRRAWTFLASKMPEKRSLLIDHLLNQPGYASHMFNYWASILRLNDTGSNRLYLRPYGDWLKECFQDNVAFDQMVFEMLTAEGKTWENPAVGYKLRDRGMPLDNLNNTVRNFLGTQIGCAQCHDHPFDRWTQQEFYELAAFEGGVRTGAPPNAKNVPDNKLINTLRESLSPQEGQRLRQFVSANRHQVYENPKAKLKYPFDYAYSNAEAGEIAKANVIFGEMPDLEPGQSRREAFALWLTSKDNPRFALTIANRMWKRTMGVGVIDEVDNITDDTEPSNQELMDFLESEMKRLDFDLKEFVRIIYHTRTYQRQVSYGGYDPAEPYYFPGPVLRRMTAEQVWDSLLTLSIKAPEAYLRPDDSEYIEALDLDGSASQDEILALLTKVPEAQKAMRVAESGQRYQSVTLRRASELPQPLPAAHFLRQFGQSDREIISEGSTEGTVPQLLALFNGPITHMMLEAGSVIYTEVEQADGISNRIRIIFLSVLGRMPTSEEMSVALSEIRESRTAGYGNIIWSLLNTREFLFVQ